MTDEIRCTPEEIDQLYDRLERDAEAHGYHLNPDREFTRDLVEGLVYNEKRFGYRACPCRLASGERSEDLDIICPCDYRDPDLSEYGNCYCALYVSDDVVEGRAETRSIPERRPPSSERTRADGTPGGRAAIGEESGDLPYPVLRCRVCGYLCARDEAPGKCPICGAASDRFERFL